MNRSQVKQPCGEVNGDQSSWTDAHQLTDEFRSSPGGGQYPHPPPDALISVKRSPLRRIQRGYISSMTCFASLSPMPGFN